MQVIRKWINDGRGAGHKLRVSPAMERLLVRYRRYFEITAANPSETIVPTVDIDLAWHTHQPSPRSYFQFPVGKTKNFVDHNDKFTRLNSVLHGI